MVLVTSWTVTSRSASTGLIFGVYHRINEWTVYHDPGIIPVGAYAGKVSREQLVRAADRELADRGLLESEGTL